MAVRVSGNTEFAASYTDPCVITFDTSPTSGNLLLAGMAERSGTGVSNFTIADDGSDTGWAELVSHDNTHPSYRVSFKVWHKISDGTEDQITLDDGTGNSKFGFISEYELEAGEAWNAFDTDWRSTDDAQNVGTSESLSSDDTASVSGDNFLVMSFSALKTNASRASFSTDFDDGINNVHGDSGDQYTVILAMADKNDSITGVRSDTANFSDSNSHSTFISMIAVFDLTAAAPPGGDVEIFRRRIEGY